MISTEDDYIEESGYRLDSETDDVGEMTDISILNSLANLGSPRLLHH